MKKLLFIPLLLITSLCYSAPTINSVSGAISEGESIVLSIADINSDLSGESILAYDDFEINDFDDYWATTNYLTISGTNADTNRDGNSSYLSALNCTNAQHYAQIKGADSPLSNKWYISKWIYLDDDWDWGTSVFGGGDQFLSNIKILRLWNPGSINENFKVEYQGWENYLIAGMEAVSGSGAGTMLNARTKIAKGQWNHFQFEFIESSSASTADGIFRMWLNGSLEIEITDLVTREDYDVLKRPNSVGFQNVWGSTTDTLGDQAPNGFYMDDVYVNNSLVRVEIGDNSDYNSCTHREVCKITGISGSDATVEIVQGTFGDENAYIFYVDADGSVSNGYGITIGAAISSSISGAYSISGACSIS